MAPPTGTYVDLVTGQTVNGPVQAGGNFSWYNSNTNPQSYCTVTNVGTWCQYSSYGPIGADSSAAAVAKSGLSTGAYNFACPCCRANNPSVGVHGPHPKPPHEK